MSALARRYGQAIRQARGLDRRQAAKLLLSLLKESLGGDGWDDPRMRSLRMIEMVEGNLNWPLGETTVTVAAVQKMADELVAGGFDPRHLVETM